MRTYVWIERFERLIFLFLLTLHTQTFFSKQVFVPHKGMKNLG
jgi:hypothetical protein